MTDQFPEPKRPVIYIEALSVESILNGTYTPLSELPKKKDEKPLTKPYICTLKQY